MKGCGLSRPFGEKRVCAIRIWLAPAKPASCPIRQGAFRRKVPPSGEFHDHRVDGDAVAGLDLLALADAERNDEARNWAAHRFLAVGQLFYRHQPRIASLTLGIDEG